MLCIGISIVLLGIIIILLAIVGASASKPTSDKVIARYTQRGWHGHSKNF